jgi:DNA mismatch endonuclease (patch repair protein)
MVDKITPEHRSWNMSRIRGSDTEPEKRVRSLLHRIGLRFSLKKTALPGKPDIILPARRTVVFVNGCFWHRHKDCVNSVLPKTRPDFWLTKLQSNVDRDRKNIRTLRKLGWQVLVVWECELADETKLINRMLRIFSNSPS